MTPPYFQTAPNICAKTGCRAQHPGEPLDQRPEEELGHAGHEFVEHASMAEQRMGAAPGRVGFEMPVIAERFPGGSEQRQQDHGEGVGQPQAVPPVGSGAYPYAPMPARSAHRSRPGSSPHRRHHPTRGGNPNPIINPNAASAALHFAAAFPGTSDSIYIMDPMG